MLWLKVTDNGCRLWQCNWPNSSKLQQTVKPIMDEDIGSRYICSDNASKEPELNFLRKLG